MGCFSCLKFSKLKYVRLIDAVYPANLEDPIVSDNVQALTYYAVTQPRRLNRIGKYVRKKISRDLQKKRFNYVHIGVQVVDRLLQSCHANLNLFVESVLKIVEILLEAKEYDMLKYGTDIFTRFSSIREESPSYHRQYDFFVSKFSSMCLKAAGSDSESAEVMGLRVTGLRGLRSLIRKTVDDLNAYIWVHCDTIVPALLLNMEDETGGLNETVNSDIPSGMNGMEHMRSMSQSFSNIHLYSDGNVADENSAPRKLAQSGLRNLVMRADFQNMASVIKPVLIHFDSYDLWTPCAFAFDSLRLLMVSSQPQFVHIPITELIRHLNATTKSWQVKRSIVEVLYRLAPYAHGSLGPSVLEVYNAFIKHLLLSSDGIEKVGETEKEDISKFQDALIIAFKVFSEDLPDFQIVEVMSYILSKCRLKSPDMKRSSLEGSSAQTGNTLSPSSAAAGSKTGNVMKKELSCGALSARCNDSTRRMLITAFLGVATCYSVSKEERNYPLSMINPLVHAVRSGDPEMRLVIQKVFRALIRRRAGRKASLIQEVDLTKISIGVVDLSFIQNYGDQLRKAMTDVLTDIECRREDILSIFQTVALMLKEFGYCELFSGIRLAFLLQEHGESMRSSDNSQAMSAHAFAAAYMQLAAVSTKNQVLKKYVNGVLKARRDKPDLFNDSEILLDELSVFDDDKHMETEGGATTGNDTEKEDDSVISQKQIKVDVNLADGSGEKDDIGSSNSSLDVDNSPGNKGYLFLMTKVVQALNSDASMRAEYPDFETILLGKDDQAKRLGQLSSPKQERKQLASIKAEPKQASADATDDLIDAGALLSIVSHFDKSKRKPSLEKVFQNGHSKADFGEEAAAVSTSIGNRIALVDKLMNMTEVSYSKSGVSSSESAKEEEKYLSTDGDWSCLSENNTLSMSPPVIY
eukprot:Nk52_evm26s248 gene=Nk52_evmTU26s248